ncbi:MAG: magnesium transporter [Candidatus Bathyarchaeia archaeon]
MASEDTYRAGVIIKECAPILLTAMVFALVAGSNLENARDLILGKALIILMTVPAFINMEGGLASVFSSRVTSHLFVGTLDSNFKPRRILFRDIGAITLVALTGFLFLAALTAVLNRILMSSPLDDIVIINVVVLAGLTTTVAMCGIGLVGAYVSFRRGLNPDNFTAPVTLAVGDALGIFLLILALRTLAFL